MSYQQEIVWGLLFWRPCSWRAVKVFEGIREKKFSAELFNFVTKFVSIIRKVSVSEYRDFKWKKKHRRYISTPVVNFKSPRRKQPERSAPLSVFCANFSVKYAGTEKWKSYKTGHVGLFELKKKLRQRSWAPRLRVGSLHSRISSIILFR